MKPWMVDDFGYWYFVKYPCVRNAERHGDVVARSKSLHVSLGTVSADT